MSIFDRFKTKPAVQDQEVKQETTSEPVAPVEIPAEEQAAEALSQETPQPEQPQEALVPASDFVRTMLQQMNCEFQEQDRQHSVYYLFDYQNGHFRVDAAKQANVIQIEFPYIFDTELECLNFVRTHCNETNFRTRFSRFLYHYDEKSHRVVIHIFTGCLIPEHGVDRFQSFRSLLDSHFALQREFCTRLEEILKNAEKGKPQDLEMERIQNLRVNYLLAEQELMHQSLEMDVRAHEAKAITVGQLVRQFYKEETSFDEMRVVTDNLLIIGGNEAVQNYNILTPLLEGEGEQAKLKIDEATLILKGKRESVTLQITPTVEADKAIYFRVNILCPDLPVNARRERNLETSAFSFLIVYDKVSEENHEAEFRYMWEDAKAKKAANNFKEMTDEQKLICDLDQPNLAIAFYWGRKYFEENRCYEALHHLEFIYKELNQSFLHLDDSMKERFYHVCSMIGFCYNELHLFQKAYFYLDVVFQLQRYTDSVEYVNCLANSKDFRAIYVINAILDGLAQADEHAEETEAEGETVARNEDPNLVAFRNFLRRRKAYVLLDLHRVDEAEKLLQELLKEPANADFALGELAYLQQMKEK